VSRLKKKCEFLRLQFFFKSGNVENMTECLWRTGK